MDEKNNVLAILTIKTEVPTLNQYIRAERGNMYKAAKIKKEKTLSIAREVLAQTRDIIDQKVDLEITWYTKGNSDPDNIYFGIKFILDGIVVSGLLKNDNQKCIGSILNTYVKGDKNLVVLKIVVGGGVVASPF